MKPTNPFLWLGVVVVAGLAVVGYDQWRDGQMRTTAAGERVPAATSAQMQMASRIEKRWADATQLAGSTARIALPTVIADMQAQRRELDDAELGPCLDDASTMLAMAMDETIALYFAFVGSDDERTRQLVMAERAGAAEGALDQYRKRKQACAP